MKQLSDRLKSIREVWVNTLTPAREAELADLQAHLGQTVTFTSIADQMQSWIGKLEAIAAKPRVSKSKPKYLVEGLEQALDGLKTAVDQHAAPISTIVQRRNLGIYLLVVGHLVQALEQDSSRDYSALVDAAKDKLRNDLATIEAVAQLAQRLSAEKTEIELSIAALGAGATAFKAFEEQSKINFDVTQKELEAIQSKAKTALDEVMQTAISETQTAKDAALVELNAVSSEFETKHKDFLGNLERGIAQISEANKVKGEIDGILTSANATSAAAETKLNQARIDLEAAQALRTRATERLTEALRDVQREGLAGAFTRKVEETKKEITSEQKRFLAALIYIATTAIASFAIAIATGSLLDFKSFLVRFTQTVAVAAPGIWLAWLSARRLGALTRVFGDYQYKSAAALAYESYRKEVDEAANDELRLQLLGFAVQTFGDNPTRHYEGTRDEPVLPIEALMERFPFLKKAPPATVQPTAPFPAVQKPIPTQPPAAEPQ